MSIEYMPLVILGFFTVIGVILGLWIEWLNKTGGR